MPNFSILISGVPPMKTDGEAQSVAEAIEEALGEGFHVEVLDLVAELPVVDA